MKIFSATQIKACDNYTIHAERIASIDLMERAANKCVDWIKDKFPRQTLFIVLCGTGNNGGDGLAITRLLHQKGYGARAFVLKISEDITPDCYENLQRLQAIDSSLVSFVEQGTYITELQQDIVIVDALFGTGLNRPLQGWISNFINHINALRNVKLSIDMPSGLPADIISDQDMTILKATYTLSFQFYKRAFLHPESAPYIGDLHILDIKLSDTFIQATPTHYSVLLAKEAASLLRVRSNFAHKGNMGHVLLAAGSIGKIGAAVLAAKAVLRSGAGLLTVAIPEVGLQVLQSTIPEAMSIVSGKDFIDTIPYSEKYNVVAIGPGLDTQHATVTALASFLETCKLPVIVDADALNIIAQNPELLHKLPPQSIITPHPKEFSRLFGSNTNSMIQVDNARIQAMRYNINIVLKGHHTAVISSEGDCFYNSSGNSGMATGGSGDVLTGVIAGLLAQGYSPIHAAQLGVYLHGLAADIALELQSEESLIASDIIACMGKAFQYLHQLHK